MLLTAIIILVLLNQSQCQVISKLFEKSERIPSEFIKHLVLFNYDSLLDDDLLVLSDLFQQSQFSIQIFLKNKLEEDFLQTKSLIIFPHYYSGIIWNELNQNSFSENIWWVIKDQEDLDFTSNVFRFGLQSLIFGIDQDSLNITQYLGDGTQIPKRLNHSETLDNMDWSKIISDTKSRKDFNGLELKVNYGDFPPFCLCTSSNPEALNGALVETIREVSLTLNLTLKLQSPLPENHGVWAKKLPNGTYLGKLKEVHDGYADTSVAGFQFDIARHAYVDFSVDTFKSFITIIIRRPNQLDMNLRYFLLEFSTESWILVLLSYAFLTLFTFFILCLVYKTNSNIDEVESLFDGFNKSLNICLSAFINKVKKLCK